VRKDKVIYIAMPYRADTINGILHNIARARDVAESLWRLGFVVLCPHLNTAFMDGAIPDEAFLRGDLELLRRSDAVFTGPGWDESEGAIAEVNLATSLGMPVFEDEHSLVRWAIRERKLERKKEAEERAANVIAADPCFGNSLEELPCITLPNPAESIDREGDENGTEDEQGEGPSV